MNDIYLSDETLRNIRMAVFPGKASLCGNSLPQRSAWPLPTLDTTHVLQRTHALNFSGLCPPHPHLLTDWVWETSTLPWHLVHTLHHMLATEGEYYSVNVWQCLDEFGRLSADRIIMRVPTCDLRALLGHTRIKLWLLLQGLSFFWICFSFKEPRGFALWLPSVALHLLYILE